MQVGWEQSPSVAVTPFGVCPAGAVHGITLRDGAGMAVELLSLGAAIRSVTVLDRWGAPTDVCLGYDSPADYWLRDGYLGACCGRCANRIGGSVVTVGGQVWPLTPNEGKHHLHGGRVGFDHRLWSFEPLPCGVTFTLISRHLDQGYPGELKVSVTYTLVSPGRLEITYRAIGDRDTVVNLTNHAYFNLSGHGAGLVSGHRLTVAAQSYTPCTADNIPTGALRAVTGTPLDFTAPTQLEQVLTHPDLAHTRGLDHNVVLDRSAREAARLYSPDTGIALAVETDRPGLQLYSAGFLGVRRGKGGAVYGPHSGLCLETQHFPDAIHHPGFPSPILPAGTVGLSRTVYRFSAGCGE